MSVLKEARAGWFYSLLGGVVASFIYSIVMSVFSVKVLLDWHSSNGFIDVIIFAVGSFLLASVMSFIPTAIVSALFGIPLYCLLKKLKLANPFLITLIGGVFAFFAVKGGTSMGDLLFVPFGAIPAFLFWLGANAWRVQSAKELSSQENKEVGHS